MFLRRLTGNYKGYFLAAFAFSLIAEAVWAQSPPSIIGTWKLVAFENHNADGSVIYPFGKKPTGYLSMIRPGTCRFRLCGIHL